MTRPMPPDRGVSVAVSVSSLPRVGMTPQVKDREHRNQVGFRRKEHPVRKVANQSAPNVFLDDRKLKRIFQEPGQDGIDLRLESEAEARTLALVSKRRLEDLELGLRRDVESPHLANGAEVRQQFLADLRPGTRGHLAAPVCGQALGNDLPMPVRNRDLFWMLSEMVPQRLNVVEPLVGRELVEASGRKRRVQHDPSIRASSTAAESLPATALNWRQKRRWGDPQRRINQRT